jgi:serine protease Do
LKALQKKGKVIAMKKKNKILLTCSLSLVALSFFIIGLLTSSTLDITPSISALGEEDANNEEISPQKNTLDFVTLAENLKPVAVNISTAKVIKRTQRNPRQPFGENDRFREFFGDDFERFFEQNPGGRQKLRSLGSGFIIDKEGYIITNNHVIEGADEITVKLSDKEEFDAKLIGRDPKTDIALIKIDPDKELPVAQLGDSDILKVGEWVMAIGNPFGLEQTVTAGIVSAKWRKIGMGPYEDFIQTDAAINQGNSGGPLFNTRGEVVGVNSAIFSTSGGNIGIGFAIPINLAKNVVAQLKEKGKVVRGWLGISIQTITPELAESFGLEDKKGALVAGVEGNSPADKAGIEKGDIIIAFDGKEIDAMNELPLQVAQTSVGKEVKVTLYRDGKTITKEVIIGELEEDTTYALADKKREKELGMDVRDITEALARQYSISEEKGVVVTYVEGGSPAETAGIREGDVIVEVNRTPVEDSEQYYAVLKKAKEDDRILFWITRGRSSMFVVVSLDDN